MRKLKNMFKTMNKKAVAVGSAIVGTASQAAVTTTDATTGVTTLGGSLDTTMYSSGIPIVIGFITFTLTVGSVIGLLKRAR